MILERILKPWYVWRPLQLVSRARLALAPPKPGEREIRTAWGVSLLAEPRTALGWSIAATGVHDLAVTECLARLIRAGDQVLDVGAHVGYTATLARIAAGPAGHVHAWEPNPGLHTLLERNAAAVTKRYRTAAITARAAAVGAAPGTARLVLPDRQSLNDATAHLNPGARPSDDSLLVAIETIDDVVGNGRVGGTEDRRRRQ